MLVDSGFWVRPTTVPPEGGFGYMAGKIIEILPANLDELWVEMYYPFRTSKGYARKNTHPLILLVGGILGVALARGIVPVSVDPREWKNWVSLNDTPTPTPIENPHEKDAVLIGMYAQVTPDFGTSGG
jgi:hypothetical protein